MNDLKQTVGRGVMWNTLQRAGKNAIGLVVTILLARMLVPAEFGLIAMIAVFLSVATAVMDSGFTQALIRKPVATDLDFSTAFSAHLALGVLAYLLLFAGAPAIARFYDAPALVALVRVAGLVVVINATQTVQLAALSRDLDFKRQMGATLPASAISGLAAVAAAFAGWGVWALVVQMLLASAITGGIYWAGSPWRPAKTFDAASFREMYRFGSRLFVASVIDAVFLNLYVLVIARMFAAVAAGHYFLASSIRDLILVQFVSAVQAVTFPALASIQEDADRLREGYRQVVKVIAFVLFPVLLLTAVLADPVFRLLLPPAWLPAVPYLQLLCIASLTYPLAALNLNGLKVLGRSDLLLYISLVKKVIIAVMLAATYRHGIIAIIWGQVVVSVIAYLPNSYFSSRLLGYPVRQQLRDVAPALALTSAIAIPAYFLVRLWAASPLLEVTSVLLLGVGAYAGFAVLLKLEGWTLARNVVFRKIMAAEAT